MESFSERLSTKAVNATTVAVDAARDKSLADIVDTFMPPVVRFMRWLFLFLVFVGVTLVMAGAVDLFLIKTFSPTFVPLLLAALVGYLAVNTFRYAFRVRRVVKRRPEIEAALKGLGSLDRNAMDMASGLLPKLRRGRPVKRFGALRELVALASAHPVVANGRDMQRDLFGPLSQLAIYGGVAALVLIFAFVPLVIAAVLA